MCKCSILTAIASGYAGRDPQGGFAMEAFKVLVEIFMKKTKVLLCFWKMKEELKVKVKKKAIDEEGGENQRMTIYKWIGKKRVKNDLEDVVKEIVLAIYAKEIKEKKED